MSQSGSYTSGGMPKNPTFGTIIATTAFQANAGAVFDLYNTADKTTNYERLRADVSANVFCIFSQYGGSAVSRAVQVGVASSSGGAPTTYMQVQSASGATPAFLFQGASWAGADWAKLNVNLNGSGGTQTVATVAPTLNQSGTAGYIALDINPTETATGSGTKLLQRWAVGGSEKGRVGNDGVIAGLFLSSTGNIGFSTAFGSANDVTLFRDAADTLAQRRATNAQTRRTYETYTDASNYSRIYEAANSGGFAYYGTQAAGTGTRRPLIVQHFATTVAALPAAATAGAGSRCFVSDALGPVFGAAVVGGGAVNVPVYSDGAAWIVG